jgi:hypothetical protein
MEIVLDRCSTLLAEFGSAFDNYFTYFSSSIDINTVIVTAETFQPQ